MSEDNPGVSVSNGAAGGLVAAGSAGGTVSVQSMAQVSASGSLDSRGGTAGQQVGEDVVIDVDGGSIESLQEAAGGGPGRGKAPQRSVSNRHKVKFMFRPPEGQASFDDDGKATDSDGEIARGALARKLGAEGAADMERRMNLGQDLAGTPMQGGS